MSVYLCRIPHGYALLRRIAPSSLVCRSLCQSVTLVSPEKTAEAIKLPFALRTRVGPMNHVLHDVYRPTWEAAILSGNQADHRSRIRYLSKKNSRILTNFPKLKNSLNARVLPRVPGYPSGARVINYPCNFLLPDLQRQFALCSDLLYE